MPQFSNEIQVFISRQTIIEHRILRDVSDARFHFERLLDNIVTGNADETCRRPRKSSQYFYGRGFSGAVGAKQCEYLAGLDTKRKIIDGNGIAIIFTKTEYLDHCDGILMRTVSASGFISTVVYSSRRV